MTPIIRHLRDTLSELPFSEVEKKPLPWTLTETLQTLEPNFYHKLVSLHWALSLEYSLLGQQLRTKLLSEKPIDKEELEEQLITALMLAELLEHTYQSYLNIPREVIRLRRHQKIYRELLAEIIQPIPFKPEQLENPPSFSQNIRNKTAFINLYRLLFVRSKRALDIIATLGSASDSYRNFVAFVNKYTNPFLAHLAWAFFIPRLSVNLFLLVKHTIPGSWMSEQEKSLGWQVRFNAHLQYLWFELGNDSLWITAGLINRFILTGTLAPFAVYVSTVCFAIDVILSVARASIELSRLYELQKYYQDMLKHVDSMVEQRKINEHLDVLRKQLNFEWFRLGSHMMITTAIFLAMAVAMPLLGFNPLIISIGAICLVAICFINFGLFQRIEEQRPKDSLELPKNSALRFRFFAKKEQKEITAASEEERALEVNNPVTLNPVSH